MNIDHDMQDSISTAASSTSTVFVVHPVVDAHDAHDRTPPNPALWPRPSPSRPSSPVSDTPPDSPSLTDPGSISSLPSVSSSFFFSSAAATPPPPPHSLESLPHVQGYAVHMGAPHHEEDHHSDTDSHGQSTGHLIIPSLSLPAALRRPTAYGQALGDVRILVLKLSDAPHPDNDPREPNTSRQFLNRPPELDSALDIGRLLVESNEDIVDVGMWEPFHPLHPRHDGSIDAGTASWRSLRASTDWIEHHDAHGLEKYEPSRNVEIVEITIHLPPASTSSSFDSEYQTYDRLIRPALTSSLTDIQTFLTYPFRELTNVLHPSLPSYTSSLVHTLLAAAGSPLCAGLLLVYDLYNDSGRGNDSLLGSPQMGRRRTARQAFDPRVAVAEHIITESLSSYVPIIKLPSSASASMLYPIASQTSLSSRLRDPTHSQHFPSHYLQPGSILHSSTLPFLRREAAERFLRWYEIDRIVGHFGVPSRKLITQAPSNDLGLNAGSSEYAKEKDKELIGGGALQPYKSTKRTHDEADFEKRRAQWESELSIQVALRRPGATPTASHQNASGVQSHMTPPPSHTHYPLPYSLYSHDTTINGFDPLHFPSILWFSLSLLGPFSRRVGNNILRPFRGVLPIIRSASFASHSAEDTITGDHHHALVPASTPPRRKREKASSLLTKLKRRSWVAVGIIGVGVGFFIGASIGFGYHSGPSASV